MPPLYFFLKGQQVSIPLGVQLDVHTHWAIVMPIHLYQFIRNNRSYQNLYIYCGHVNRHGFAIQDYLTFPFQQIFLLRFFKKLESVLFHDIIRFVYWLPRPGGFSRLARFIQIGPSTGNYLCHIPDQGMVLASR
ncbi:MAG: hypothetical protein K9L23_22295 [Desulfotignum sp.]|nr:hypothetical protein [Desulfotignum sp.]MCF8090777.1 hypothetical protein [Desulfotignum sp.]